MLVWWQHLEYSDGWGSSTTWPPCSSYCSAAAPPPLPAPVAVAAAGVVGGAAAVSGPSCWLLGAGGRPWRMGPHTTSWRSAPAQSMAAAPSRTYRHQCTCTQTHAQQARQVSLIIMPLIQWMKSRKTLYKDHTALLCQILVHTCRGRAKATRNAACSALL